MQVDENTLKKSLLYSEELGIDLRQNDDKELFKWFLASILFGARISETIAKNTYRTFERYPLLEPKKILNAGWDCLVDPIMRQGGYVRYDGKTSTKVLRDCEMLLRDYVGSLMKMHARASSREELEEMVQRFYGIGPVTANIFLRELSPFWKKSDPAPLPIVPRIARRYRIDLDRYDRKTITFTRIEAGLLRLRKKANNRTSTKDR